MLPTTQIRGGSGVHKPHGWERYHATTRISGGGGTTTDIKGCRGSGHSN